MIPIVRAAGAIITTGIIKTSKVEIYLFQQQTESSKVLKLLKPVLNDPRKSPSNFRLV